MLTPRSLPILLLGCLPLSSCVSTIPQKELEHIVSVQSADPLEKIFRETFLFRPHEPVAHVAKGEHATFQFAIRAQLPVTKLKCI